MSAAYQADGRPIGRDEFYRIACDPRRSVVVEACAGAGKTWMLVSRIVRALLDGAQPHEILAITFTRKAAGEMRQRLDDWLREFAEPGLPAHALADELIARGAAPAEAQALAPALAGLHERVLDAGRSVEIRTFHGWFSQLLRAAPLELLDEIGLQAEVDLIEDPQDHRAEVFRRFHAALLADPQARADHADLIARRGRFQVRKWLEAAWSRRIDVELAAEAGTLDDSVVAASVQWPELAPFGHPGELLRTPPWQATLREVAGAFGGGARGQTAAQGLADAMQASDPAEAFEALWSALFTKDDKPRQLGNVPGLAALQQQVERLGRQVHQHESHLEHRAMARLARLLLAEFASYKRSRGLADMADLERCALLLLRDATLSAWVQERLDARVRHVLIDEFQDTSPLQWQALNAWLAGYAGAGGGASGQRPPAVFIVGDPKQSIYRFRGAEPRVFAEAAAFVTESFGGVRLACDHTRRNAPEVIAALNGVFAPANAAGEYAGFRPHTTELAEQPPQPGAGVRELPLVMRPRATGAAAAPAAGTGWRDSLEQPRREPETVLREREAAWVAAAIGELVHRDGVRPGEIMVLSRKRESLRLVGPALQRAHLPFAAVEEVALTALPEARDVIALLDLLASPRHRLSLLQVLRCPLFGADEDDLVQLASRAAAEQRDWWPTLCRGEWTSRALREAAAALPRWRDAAQRLPPHDLLDRIVHEGRMHERFAAAAAPERRAAALDALDAVLAQALLLDGARYATPYNFVRALRRRTITVTPPSHPDAVQLLTIHGAKGLEARVVFVMDADPQAANPDTTTLLVDWPVESAAPRCCAFLYSQAQCPESLQRVLDAEREAAEREELNGLYVAMSRARERLVFSATEPLRPMAGRSWRQRLQGIAAPWIPVVAEAARSGVAGDTRAVVMKRLPTVPEPEPTLQPEHDVRAAAKGQAPRAEPGAQSSSSPASVDDRSAREDGSAPETDTVASRLGSAVHRALEWATGAAQSDAADIAPLAQAAALEFGVPDALEVGRIARTILRSPQASRFFAADGIEWSGNEVPVSHDGEVLRIDRLVLLAAEGAEPATWWVLDYKLHHAPQALEAYRSQLARYREAVRRATPGALVRAAFLTGAGEVVEVD